MWPKEIAAGIQGGATNLLYGVQGERPGKLWLFNHQEGLKLLILKAIHCPDLYIPCSLQCKKI